MAEPIRVLHVVSGLEGGGIEKMLQAYYQDIDRSLVQFDFVTHRPPGLVEKSIKHLGCRIYHISFRRKYPLRSAVEALRIFQSPEYHIVHLHGNIEIVPQLFMALLAGKKRRIVHSHMAFPNPTRLNDYSNRLASFFLKWLATDYFACSNAAGIWAYGKNILEDPRYRVIYNAFALERFAYQPEKRRLLREKWGLENCFVVGHIGRFCYQKNQEFVIDIFYEIKKRRENAVLLLIGQGDTLPMVQRKVEQAGLSGCVRFLGERDDIPDWLQVMDVFLSPSRFEGLSIASVEAQAAGLRCVVSDATPQEAKVTGNLWFMPLEASPGEWAGLALDDEGYCREGGQGQIAAAGYDIKEQSKLLGELYRSF